MRITAWIIIALLMDDLHEKFTKACSRMSSRLRDIDEIY